MSNQKEDLEGIYELMVNMHRHMLHNKPHIRKYKKLRKLETEIFQNMIDFVLSDNSSLKNYMDAVFKVLDEANYPHDLYLDINNVADLTIIEELVIFKVHPEIESLTEYYLDKKKFRSAEKLKMLESFKNSYVGLFEVLAVDVPEGYVHIKDVFTKKEFKIIDIKLSAIDVTKYKTKTYIYNRIITYEDISFGVGINCPLDEKSKHLKNFIKGHKYDQSSDLMRCVELYNISKNRI